MSGKKILFINHWAKKLGGAELSLLDILSDIPKDVTAYLITTENGILIEKACEYGISCKIVFCNNSVESIRRTNLFKAMIFSWRPLFHYLVYVIRLKKIINEINPDIIHTNVPKSHVALFIIALLDKKYKMIFHIRELFNKKSMAIKLYQYLFPKKNAYIISVSNAVQKSLPIRLQEKSTVIHNGIKIQKQFRKQLYTNNSTVKLVYLGRIVPWKGCEYLIKVLELLIKDGYNAILDLIGGTYYWPQEYRFTLNEFINSKGLHNSCKLLPNTTEPLKVLNNYDIFVNASLNEPFGRNVAEAQASGLPVVTFDSGGVSEIIENNITGYIVPYKNITDFAEKIKLITNNNNINKMSKLANERARKYFNKETQIKKIWKIINNI